MFDDWSSLVYERHVGLDTRQLLYRISEYEIDLRLEFAEDKCLISGQLLPAVGDARLVMSGAGENYHAEITELGEFTIGPVASGAYDLTISIGRETFRLPNIPLDQ